MTKPNPFSAWGKEVVPYARRRKLEKQAEVKVLTPQEKKQAEQEKLHQLWLEDFTKRKKVLLGGKYGAQAMALCAKLEALTFDDSDLLIDLAKVWLPTDRETRAMVISLIYSAVIELRERHGLSPFDDPLWDEPPNTITIIIKLLS
jgi:hypothetical protein